MRFNKILVAAVTLVLFVAGAVVAAPDNGIRCAPCTFTATDKIIYATVAAANESDIDYRSVCFRVCFLDANGVVVGGVEQSQPKAPAGSTFSFKVTYDRDDAPQAVSAKIMQIDAITVTNDGTVVPYTSGVAEYINNGLVASNGISYTAPQWYYVGSKLGIKGQFKNTSNTFYESVSITIRFYNADMTKTVAYSKASRKVAPGSIINYEITGPTRWHPDSAQIIRIDATPPPKD